MTEHDTIAEARAVRDSEVTNAVNAAWIEALGAIQQQAADAVVSALAAGGWLRLKPASAAVVKRILRDDRGQIDVIVERIEQVETTP